MKINEINLKNLKRKTLALVAIPVMLGSLTACHKAENKNTKTEVVSESTETLPVLNSTETTTATTTTSTSTTGASTTTTKETTTTTETTTAVTTTKKEQTVYPHELITEEEYNKLISKNLSKENASDLFVLIGKDRSVEQAKQVCEIILSKANDEGKIGASKTSDVSYAILSKKCLSPEMVELIKKASTTVDADKIVNLDDELKEKYIYMNNLYVAYLKAVEEKDTYLMIINGAKIYDGIRNLDELLLKNKITSDERLNYFVSYSDGELKDSNLFLGESLLKDYFEEMRYYVSSENYVEYCEWASTNYAVENVFDMIEEQFVVEKINDKYVALKIDEDVLSESNQKVLK